MKENQTYIVIAAYNEGRSINNVVCDLISQDYKKIIVVDDGSSDRTAEFARKAGAIVLRHIINRGQGAALKTGIDFALLNKADLIVTFDADGQHRVEDLEAMISPVRTGKVDVTLGSRFLSRKTNIPFGRILTLKIGIIVQRIFYGIKLTDAHNGFRCFSRNAASKIRIISDRMEHASEIIDEIRKHRLKYKEVPVIINYTKETLERGHGSFFQGIRVFFKMILHKLTK